MRYQTALRPVVPRIPSGRRRWVGSSRQVARGNRTAGDGAAAPLIDLHCHILPALDDGAIDLADSVGMARQAESDGIEIVCATPHIRPDHDVRVDELEARVEAVNEALVREGVSTRVRLGGEVAELEVERLDDEFL